MKVFFTNDDGYFSKGINELASVFKSDYDTTILAPDRERSCCGHALSLTKPLRMNKVSEMVYSATGFPADCALLALSQFYKDSLPDIAFTGINHGSNLGQDRYYSGTMAAARELSLRGVPTIAMSLVTERFSRTIDFDVAKKLAKALVDQNIQKLIPKNCFLNINVPNLDIMDISGIELTKSGEQLYTSAIESRIDHKGAQYYWVGGRYEGYVDEPGTDAHAVYNCSISVSLESIFNRHTQKDIDQLEEILSWKKLLPLLS